MRHLRTLVTAWCLGEFGPTGHQNRNMALRKYELLHKCIYNCLTSFVSSHAFMIVELFWHSHGLGQLVHKVWHFLETVFRGTGTVSIPGEIFDRAWRDALRDLQRGLLPGLIGRAAMPLDKSPWCRSHQWPHIDRTHANLLSCADGKYTCVAMQGRGTSVE